MVVWIVMRKSMRWLCCLQNGWVWLMINGIGLWWWVIGSRFRAMGWSVWRVGV